VRDLSEPSASPAIDDESWSVLESPSVVRLTAAPARSIPSRSLTELLIDGARFEQKRSRGAGGLSTWQMPSSNQRLRYLTAWFLAPSGLGTKLICRSPT